MKIKLKTKLKKVFTLKHIVVVLVALILISSSTLIGYKVAIPDVTAVQVGFMEALSNVGVEWFIVDNYTEEEKTIISSNITLEYVITDIFDFSTQEFKKSNIFHIYVDDRIIIACVKFTITPGYFVIYSDHVICTSSFSVRSNYGNHFAVEMTFWKWV